MQFQHGHLLGRAACMTDPTIHGKHLQRRMQREYTPDPYLRAFDRWRVEFDSLGKFCPTESVLRKSMMRTFTSAVPLFLTCQDLPSFRL